MTTKTSRTEKYPQIVTTRMVEDATSIAMTITGIDGFGGQRECRSYPGLVTLVQEYIDTARETKDTGMIAYESNGVYWIGYENE